MIGAMRKALQAAADHPDGDYLGAPEAVRNQCLDLCLALDQEGDARLLNILDAAEARSRVNVHKPEGITGQPVPSANQNKEPGPPQPVISRWTGEELSAETGPVQDAGQGQSRR
jgi:hypothetical protein